MAKAILYSGFFRSQGHAVNYLNYIHKQSPLFTSSGDVPIEAALAQLKACTASIQWRHILSLQGADAARLAVDRTYIRQIVAAKKDLWAKVHNISPENLILFASYHEIDSHPHLHMVMFSTDTREGWILQNPDKTQGESFKRARETVKSTFANEIFKNDLHELKVTKAQQQVSLRQGLREALAELGKSSHVIAPQLETKMSILSAALVGLPGKHQYGYLSSGLKQQVNDILHIAIEKDGTLHQLFCAYRNSQEALLDTYMDSEIIKQEKMAVWTDSFFEPTKKQDTSRHNLILRAAENMMPSIERYKKKENEDAIVVEPASSAGRHEASLEALEEEGSEPIPNNALHEPRSVFREKSIAAALRSMVYCIGSTMHEDTQRKRGYFPIGEHKKIRAKKIHKQQTIENQPIER